MQCSQRTYVPQRDVHLLAKRGGEAACFELLLSRSRDSLKIMRDSGIQTIRLPLNILQVSSQYMLILSCRNALVPLGRRPEGSSD